MITSGLVDVSPILEFARRVPAEIVFQKFSKAGPEYRRLLNDLVSDIPEVSGLYVWGRFDGDGGWESVYVGKTTHGKVASLRYRISDEMCEEKPFAWAALEDVARLRAIYSGIWGNGLRSIRHFDRAVRKARTQQIAWVACPAYDEQTIRACEAALIGHFAPHANRQQRKGSDSPEQVIPLLHTFHAIGVRR